MNKNLKIFTSLDFPDDKVIKNKLNHIKYYTANNVEISFTFKTVSCLNEFREEIHILNLYINIKYNKYTLTLKKIKPIVLSFRNINIKFNALPTKDFDNSSLISNNFILSITTKISTYSLEYGKKKITWFSENEKERTIITLTTKFGKKPINTLTIQPQLINDALLKAFDYSINHKYYLRFYNKYIIINPIIWCGQSEKLKNIYIGDYKKTVWNVTPMECEETNITFKELCKIKEYIESKKCIDVKYNLISMLTFAEKYGLTLLYYHVECLLYKHVINKIKQVNNKSLTKYQLFLKSNNAKVEKLNVLTSIIMVNKANTSTKDTIYKKKIKIKYHEKTDTYYFNPQ